MEKPWGAEGSDEDGGGGGQGQTCPAGVGGEVVGVCGLQALLYLLEKVFDLVLHPLLERFTDLHRESIHVPSRCATHLQQLCVCACECVCVCRADRTGSGELRDRSSVARRQVQRASSSLDVC